jgi:hypothetical protein
MAIVTRRLPRLRLEDPTSVVGGYRRGRGLFWGALGMARHAHRMQEAEKHPELLPAAIHAGLLHLPRMDAMLAHSGRAWSLDPDGGHNEATWGAHLQWGGDQLVETAFHLRAGRTLAAIVIARSQLERWTLNIAHHFGIEPREAEGTAAYFRRVWSTYPQVDVDVGEHWAALSEYLHGRSIMTVAQTWESVAGDVRNHSIEVPAETLQVHALVAASAETAFLQVRGGVRVLVEQSGRQAWADLMMSRFEVEYASDIPDVMRVALHPLDPALAYSKWADNLIDIQRGYRETLAQAARRDAIADLDKANVLGALLERRARAVHRFRVGMKHEAEVLGDDFDMGGLIARLFRYITIAEGAEVVSYWTDQPEDAAALRLAGGALRSAFYLWLQDTDVAMACVRVLLEQTCQARARRLRPQRAKRVAEAPGGPTPARWIEAAGWRRAAVLGRALGEFSHISLRARLSGARRLLEDLQSGVPEEADKRHTARGNALDETAYLLAFEVLDRLQSVDQGLADAFRQEVTLLDKDEHLRAVEELLSRTQDLRTFDFGDPDFGKTDSDELTRPGTS